MRRFSRPCRTVSGYIPSPGGYGFTSDMTVHCWASSGWAAYGTVCDVYGLDPDAGNGVPAMVAAVQSFRDLLNFDPHAHSVVAEGVFLETGKFVGLPSIWRKARSMLSKIVREESAYSRVAVYSIFPTGGIKRLT